MGPFAQHQESRSLELAEESPARPGVMLCN